jgi:hypothetical protein
MEKIYNYCKIDRTKHIYFVNTNEIMVKRLFKRLNLKKKNILAFNQLNRANIDIFFWCDTYLNEESQDVKHYIQFKNHFENWNVFLNMYFPGDNFLKYFHEQKIFNQNVYIQHEPGIGAFFIDKTNQKKIYFCDKDNYNLVKSLDFQLSMFEATDKNLNIIDRIKNKSIINENIITQLFT